MGTLLNRRRYMGGGGSSPLPYDAEIEYLEATGTQWIDSGITFASGLRVTCGALYTNNYTTTQILFGPTSSSGCWCGNVNNKKWGIKGTGVGDSSLRSTISVYYDGSTTRLSLGGRERTTQSRSTTPSTNIGIFAEADTQGYKSSARLFYVIIDDVDNNVLFDAIPVRVGQTGYLYDRVSGQLFGNDGTGDFVLGSDKT